MARRRCLGAVLAGMVILVVIPVYMYPDIMQSTSVHTGRVWPVINQRQGVRIAGSESMATITDHDALFHALQDERRFSVAEFCRVNNVRPKTLPKYPVYIDDREKKLYCLPPKVGCTTWKRALGLISGQITDEEIRNLTETLYPEKYINNPSNLVHHDDQYLKRVGLRRGTWPLSHREQDEYYKIIIVRDPFLRLVSAYQDKVETFDGDRKNTSQFGHILRTYLHLPKEETISFHQLLEYIEGVGDGPHEANNVHFNTYNTLCRPCEVKYDFIGKMETLHEDAEYIFRNILHTNLSLDLLLDTSKGPNTKRVKHTNSSEKSIMLYSNISDEARHTVQSYLSADCQLFGYDSEQWIGYR